VKSMKGESVRHAHLERGDIEGNRLRSDRGR
jgi:hypothetical protein